MAKKYVSLSKLSTFLDNLKSTFASLTHTHKISDITDYKIDTQLSSASNNPVANKVLDAEFEAVSQALDVFEQALDDKASSSHNHDDRYYTEDEINTKLSGKSDTSHNHNGVYATVDHDHDDTYALSGHNHSGVYAEVGHNHDNRYYTETEIDTKLDSKSDSTHNHDGVYSKIGHNHDSAYATKTHNHDGVYAEANHNHDTKYDGKGTASSAVSTHNTSTSAHNDIRDLIAGLTSKLNALANSDDTTLDQMSEIVAYIKANKGLIDGITTSKVNTSDIVNNLTTNNSSKVLSAAQGVTIKTLIDTLQAEVDKKVDSLSDLSITATVAELNYVDGVTSNIQTQLDTISDELGNHTHSASDITSGTIAAARLPKATDSAAGIVSTESQSFKGEKTFTNNITTVGLRANAANTNDIGTSLAPFKNTNTKNLYIAPQSIGGSISHYGKFIAETTGTTSTKGLTKLEVGNFIEEGREGNAQGYIQIFNNDVGSVILETGHDDDRDIRVYLPENPGTLITTDDLSGYAKSSHNHSASNITSGILPIARGGTGNSNGYVQIGALSGSTVGALATAEGRNTTASGSYSHAEGNYTEATGSSSHAEGQNTTASNTAAHAEGENTTASGAYSHAEGENTIASAKHQHVQGKFNKEDSAGTYAHIVGNGTGASTSSRSNAHTLDWNGNAWYAGDIYVGGISQNDSDASKVITKADQQWNLIYDSGEIPQIVNSISGIDVSGYTSIQVLVRCYNDGDSVNSRTGSAIFTCENGKTYQFPVWSNMFSQSINTVFTMAQFKLVDGWLICPYASRLIGDANTFEDTEGGTAGNLSFTGSGMMKCTSSLSTLTISNLDQNANYYFGMGSRVMVWGWNA